jgi:chromosome segregation ATPase
MDLLQDYRHVAREYLDEHRPARAKLGAAERSINEGTEAVARLKVALLRMEREEENVRNLLAQAPMPLAEMKARHERLKALVAEARQKGQQIGYDGQARTPAEMQPVLAAQRAEIDKYERFAATIGNIGRMRARTESAIAQAMSERAAVKTDLEYARAVTRVAEATAVTRAPFEPVVGQFGDARDVLAEVTALQETRLSTDEVPSAFAGEGELVPAK